MGVVSLKCPSCNGELQLDDAREFGFCQFCGNKVMIQDEVQKIRVEYSGQVKIDNTDQLKNCEKLADKAYAAGNYIEAYGYYSKVLEFDSSLWLTTFKRGRCAVYLSDATKPRFDEFVLVLQEMKRTDLGDQKRFVFDSTIDVAEKLYRDVCLGKWDNKFATADAAKYFYVAARYAVQFIIHALELYSTDEVKADNKLENQLKFKIDLALDICKKTDKRIEYFSGTKTEVDKHGEVESKPIYTTLSPLYAKDMDAYAEKLKIMYNQLPTFVAKIKEFDDEIAENKLVIENYDVSLNNFFISHPAEKKNYEHPGLFTRKKKLQSVYDKFTPDLLAKKTAAEASKKTIDKLTAERKKYINANFKK